MEVSFNMELAMSPQTINELITHEVLSGTMEMIWRIKKAEFLSEAQWEFKYGDHPLIRAKILDTQHGWKSISAGKSR